MRKKEVFLWTEKRSAPAGKVDRREIPLTEKLGGGGLPPAMENGKLKIENEGISFGND